jgi:shikimate dehydrogenase
MSLKFAVIGNPIAHSLSPQIHQAFAAECGIDLSYTRIEAPLSPDDERFIATARRFFADGGRGLNVTAPFKHAAFSAASAASDIVTHAEAANTLSAREDGNWRADNTDGPGLARDLARYLGALSGKSLFIHGAGGATAGVLQTLLECGARVTLYNRTAEKADALVQRFSRFGNIAAIASWDELPTAPFDAVIHATSLRAHAAPDTVWDARLYHPDTFYYDIVYDKHHTTAFLGWVAAHGNARAADGLGMLVEQAAESFRLWHGVLPDTAPVLRQLRA